MPPSRMGSRFPPVSDSPSRRYLHYDTNPVFDSMRKVTRAEDPRLNELRLQLPVHLKGLQVSAAVFDVLLLCVGLVCVTISISITLLAIYVVGAFPFYLATVTILLLLLGVFTFVFSLSTAAWPRQKRDASAGKVGTCSFSLAPKMSYFSTL
uniref:Uncharacterized protein n=1 Tax=Schistocephalus solidus TaxID=70667 RepID=A0A0X3NTH5_SCHSO